MQPMNAIAEELSQGYMEAYAAGSELDLHKNRNKNGDSCTQNVATQGAALMSLNGNTPILDAADNTNNILPEQLDIGNIFEKFQVMIISRELRSHSKSCVCLVT